MRRRELARRAADGAAPVCVLFYHRVADRVRNAWTMPVTRFRRQIDWLQKRMDVVTLAEAQRRLAIGRVYRPTVAITFDDGYGENCEAAIPLLLRRGVPFTYFVSTQIVREDLAFPHDLAAGYRLRPNTVAELRAMADAGVEIGAHTRTHADMGLVTDSAAIESEVAGSKYDLEDWLGREVRYFAFPLGLPENLSAEACRVAQTAGYAGVVSAYGAYNLPEAVSPRHGAYHLRRIHADTDWARFSNWMTFDPRKATADDPIDDDLLLAESVQENAVV